MRLFTIFVPLLLCVATASSSSTFSIQWNNTKQRIDGFGVSCAQRPQVPPKDTLDLLFDKNIGIGLTLLRSRVGYNLPNSTTEIQFALAAKAYGVTVWSSPWSPPAQWKNNNDVNDGGYLLPEYYDEYATYLSDFVQNTLTKGVQLFALSINNEPDNSPGYESCTWNATQMYNFVKILAPMLKARKLSTRIMMGESSSWDFGQSTLTLDDPVVSTYVDIIATHTYGGAAIPSPFAYSKTMWMTEWADGGTWDPTIVSALRVATKIHDVLSYSQASAFHYWWTSNSDRLADNQGLLDSKYNVSKRVYAMGHFSKFVRPNWVRIQVTPESIGNTYVSAYRHPTNGTFAIVVINADLAASSITLDLSGDNFVGVKSLTSFVTSTSQNLAKGAGATISASRTVTLNLPAQTITTFLGCANPAAAAAPPAPSKANLLSNGDYENGATTGSWVVSGGTTLAIETSDTHTGNHAAKVTQSRGNPNINMLQFNLTAGTYFYVSTWVKKQITTLWTIEMWVQVMVDGVRTYYHINDAMDNGGTPTWTHLIGGYFIPYGAVTELFVYLQKPPVNTSYVIDTSVITLSQTSTGQGSFSTSISSENSGTCPAWATATTSASATSGQSTTASPATSGKTTTSSPATTGSPSSSGASSSGVTGSTGSPATSGSISSGVTSQATTLAPAPTTTGDTNPSSASIAAISILLFIFSSVVSLL